MSPPGRYNGPKCGVPTCKQVRAPGRAKCPHHLREQSARQARRLERGQCSTCPDPVAPGRTRCATCLEYQRTYDRLKRPNRKRAS